MEENLQALLADFKKNSMARVPPQFRPYLLRCFEPWPDWTIKILKKYLRPYCPTLTDEEFKLIPELIKGFFNFEELPSNREINIAFAKLVGHLLAWFNNGSSEEGDSAEIELYKELLRGSKDQIIELIKINLPPLNQLPECAAEFSKAYYSTFDKKGNAKVAPSRPIYWALLFRWARIEKMQSMPELEAYLSKTLGKDFKVDRKNLEFICKDIGLRFRSAGRPPKFLAPPKTG